MQSYSQKHLQVCSQDFSAAHLFRISVQGGKVSVRFGEVVLQNLPGLFYPDLIAVIQDIRNRFFNIVNPEWSACILFRDDTGLIALFRKIPEVKPRPVRKG